MNEGNNSLSGSNDFTKSYGSNHYSFIKASSVVDIPNGKTKRVRHKSSYKEIAQEKANYVCVEVNLSGSMRSNHSLEQSRNKSGLSPHQSIQKNSSYKSLYSQQAIKESQQTRKSKNKSGNENLEDMSTISKKDKKEDSVLGRDSSMKDIGIFDNKNFSLPRGGLILNRSYSNPSSTPMKESTCSSHFDSQKFQLSSNQERPHQNNPIPISKSGIYANIKNSNGAVKSMQNSKSNDRYNMSKKSNDLQKSQLSQRMGINLNMVANSTHQRSNSSRNDYNSHYIDDIYGGLSEDEYNMYMRSGELQLEDLNTEKHVSIDHQERKYSDTLLKTHNLLNRKREDNPYVDYSNNNEEIRLKEKLERDHRIRREQIELGEKRKEYEMLRLKEEKDEMLRQQRQYEKGIKNEDMVKMEKELEYLKEMELKEKYEKQKQREKERERNRQIEIEKEYQKQIELEKRREYERQKEQERIMQEEKNKKYEIRRHQERIKQEEIERQRELERQMEYDKQIEEERQREIEIQLEKVKQREYEKQREQDRQKEIKRLKEIERQKEQEKQKEIERQREQERLKEIELQKEQERQKEIVRQKEQERLKEIELQKEQERQKEIVRQKEQERQKEIERQKEQDRLKEIERIKQEEWVKEQERKVEERRLLLEKLKQEEILKEEERKREKELKEERERQKEEKIRLEAKKREEELKRKEEDRIENERKLKELEKLEKERLEKEAFINEILQKEEERYFEEQILQKEEEKTRERRYRKIAKKQQRQLVLEKIKQQKQLQQMKKLEEEKMREDARIREEKIKREEIIRIETKLKEEALRREQEQLQTIKQEKQRLNLYENVDNSEGQLHRYDQEGDSYPHYNKNTISTISGKKFKATPNSKQYNQNQEAHSDDDDSLVVIQSTNHNSKQQSLSKYNQYEEQNSIVRKVFTESSMVPSPRPKGENINMEVLRQYRDNQKRTHSKHESFYNDTDINEVPLNTNDYIYSDDDDKNSSHHMIKGKQGKLLKGLSYSRSESRFSICIPGSKQKGRNSSYDNRSNSLRDQLNISNPELFMTSSFEKNSMICRDNITTLKANIIRNNSKDQLDIPYKKNSKINKPPISFDTVTTKMEENEDLQKLYIKQLEATISARNTLDRFKENHDFKDKQIENFMNNQRNNAITFRQLNDRPQLMKRNESKSKLELIPFFQDTEFKNAFKKLDSDYDDFYNRNDKCSNTITDKERLLIGIPNHYTSGMSSERKKQKLKQTFPLTAKKNQFMYSLFPNQSNPIYDLNSKKPNISSRAIMPANPFQTVLEAREFFFFNEN